MNIIETRQLTKGRTLPTGVILRVLRYTYKLLLKYHKIFKANFHLKNISEMWYLYTMEFYATRKKNEMSSFAGKWMELENIILSEVSLAQQTKNCMFSLICRH
jgi:hypothetical protein